MLFVVVRDSDTFLPIRHARDEELAMRLFIYRHDGQEITIPQHKVDDVIEVPDGPLPTGNQDAWDLAMCDEGWGRGRKDE